MRPERVCGEFVFVVVSDFFAFRRSVAASHASATADVTARRAAPAKSTASVGKNVDRLYQNDRLLVDCSALA